MSGLRYRTLRESVVDAIRIKIISHELEPGSRIVEQDLAAEFGISRGPVREALRQLEQEGLIEYARNVGCSVKHVTIEDLYEIYLMRSNYEMLAVRLCDGKIPMKVLDRMEQIMEEMKGLNQEHYGEVFTLDCEFHGELIRMVELPRLLKAWEELNYGNVIVGYSEKVNRENITELQHEIHKLILDACRRGDKAEICQAIQDHYMKGIRRLMAKSGITDRQLKFSLDF